MKQYHDLLEDILENEQETKDRTGVGTLSVFGRQLRFNLRDGFPAVTTKKLNFDSVVAELLWFLEGSTDERRLAELTFGEDRTELVGKNTIWTANADKQGKDLGYRNDDFYKGLGPLYGSQWRDFGGTSTKQGFDQIRWIIDEIRSNPVSRRLVLSAWAADKISETALPPCHMQAVFRVYGNRLYCMLTQRSADLFLGSPFNIASYALLTHIIARECKLEVGDLVYSIADAHIYLNHKKQVKKQLNRKEYPLPTLSIDDSFDLQEGLSDGFELNTAEKFQLIDYKHHPFIKAPMAV